MAPRLRDTDAQPDAANPGGSDPPARPPESETPDDQAAREAREMREAAQESGAAAPEVEAQVDEESAPDTPTDLPRRSWPRTLIRTVGETRRDNLTDLAAGLTYYAILSIFPMLLAVVSILGLIGDSATQPLIDNLRRLTPGPARDTVMTAVENLERNRGSASLLFFVSLAGAVWSASRYVSGFMRASNIIYDVEEGRPIWKKLPVRLGMTVVQVLALVVSTMAVVFTGDLARQAGDLVGLESTAVTVWNIAKWPVAVVVLLFLLALLYWAAPNVKHPGFRWLSPGSVLAVTIWIAGSAAFALYIENFGSYNKTYGTLGGVIVFLVWLWLVNMAVLVGAELNAELERDRQIEAGLPAEEQPFLEPRDTRKLGSGP
jgi:membrane protein